MTEKIRRRPYAVVLLDEIEKAHPDVFNMLLQVMEEGRLTDSFGRNIDFRNTILIMTTNAGAEAIKNESAFGFQKPDYDASYDSMKNRVQEQIEKVFRPEFLNRVDDMIVFRHLTADDLRDVVEMEVKKVRDRLKEHGLTLIITDEAEEVHRQQGLQHRFRRPPLAPGHRKLRRGSALRRIAQGRVPGQGPDHGSGQGGRRPQAIVLRGKPEGRSARPRLWEPAPLAEGPTEETRRRASPPSRRGLTARSWKSPREMIPGAFLFSWGKGTRRG